MRLSTERPRQLSAAASAAPGPTLIVSAAVLFFASLAAAAQPLPRATAASDLALTITAQSVVASGVTPGSKVVLFAVGLVPGGYDSAVVRWRTTVVDHDRDGSISFEPERGVPWKSIWTAVDLTSGKYAIGAPPEFPVRSAPLLPNAFRKTDASTVNTFLHAHTFVDLLYVTPAGGAWAIRANDGGAEDGDSASDGTTTILLEKLQPIDTGDERPKAFMPGGLLFAIDFSEMNIAVIRLTSSIVGGGQ